MNRVEIIATVDNKTLQGKLKHYKRLFFYEKYSTNDNRILMSFMKVEKRNITDFFNKINDIGDMSSYFLHFIEDDKCFEFQIGKNENESIIDFEVFCINKMIRGYIFEI